MIVLASICSALDRSCTLLDVTLMLRHQSKNTINTPTRRCRAPRMARRTRSHRFLRPVACLANHDHRRPGTALIWTRPHNEAPRADRLRMVDTRIHIPRWARSRRAGALLSQSLSGDGRDATPPW